jgi:hypothetical protein
MVTNSDIHITQVSSFLVNVESSLKQDLSGIQKYVS